jgi:hypothetical protein
MVEQGSGGDIALAFDDFGWGELRAEAHASQCTEEELVRMAISEYLGSLTSAGWSMSGQVPNFARVPTSSRGRAIDVGVTSDQLRLLQKEAGRQGVTVPQLVIHAILLRLGQS